jgi:hypothetical protein
MKSKILCFLSLIVLLSGAANAATTSFFNSSQIAINEASGVTSDTVSSNGYLFTYTMDKLFTGGGTTPIGRSARVTWPNGVEAQAVTVDPVGKAQITISRVDGNLFDISAFTAQLLASTAGTGAAFEVMPLLNGIEAYPDPIFFDASGYYKQTFSYDASTTQSTSPLTGFDTYNFNLFVDFALTGITLKDASPAAPVPIPATLWLFGSGLIGLGGIARKRKAA